MTLILELLSNTHSLNLQGIEQNLQSIIKEREQLLSDVRTKLPKAKTKKELLELFKKLRLAKTYYIVITYVFAESFGTHILGLNLSAINISLFDFLQAVDSNKVDTIRPKTQTEFFDHLVEFYKLIKKWKNKAYTDSEFKEKVHYADFYELHDELIRKIKSKIKLKDGEDELFQILEIINNS